MLVQLKCKNCNSKLITEPDGKTFVCETCGSRYIFADQEHSEVIDVNEVIEEGNGYIQKAAWYEAKYCFGLYMRECGMPCYEAYLGWILSTNECRNIKQLAKVEESYSFESVEWKTLLDVAGVHKPELLQAASDSRVNFDKKIDTQSKRPDAETVIADEVYMMGIAEYRRERSDDYDLLELCNEDTLFQTLPKHTKFIVCSAEGTTADYFESAIKETEGTVYPDKVILFAPNTGIKDKSEFLEEMFEYHMQLNVDLTVAFVNDKAKLQRLARYGRCHEPSIQFPAVGWGLDAAYIKGNRIVLLGGDYQSLNYEQPSYENGSSDLYARLSAATEERRRQMEQAAAERQREIDEENERERRRLADVDQKAYWIRNKLCRHCGGEFEGRFFKKCKNYGKSKDY